jgi:PAS domain S-box-containing protein
MKTAPEHILVLEDDEGLLQLTRRVLLRGSYQVSLAQSVEEAGALMRGVRPDLLIVDYDLKATLSGLDFFRALRDQGDAPPAILVTAFTDESRVIEALRAGVADVLPKHADYLDYLPQAVERVLSQVRLRRRLAEAEMLQQRENSFRTLAEVIPQLVWTALPDGRFDYLNKQWLEYTGLAQQQELGLGWLDVTIHPDDRAYTASAWREAVAGSGQFDLEFRLRRHDGAYRWFQTRGVPLRSAEGAILKWFGTCTDIEEHKQAAQERERLLENERSARTQAERAVRIKDEFVATLSHELRTPLNAIVGWSQFLLLDARDPAKLQKGLEVIDRNARLQARMVDDLLDMSRIMSGKLRLDIQKIDLAEVIENAIGSVQPAATARETTIRTRIAGARPMQGDPARLQQILWNLLTNAIKFTPKRGRVDLEADFDDNEVRIVVRDNGQGIAADFLDLVFDRFRQADASNTRQVSGLGLGLAITRELVEMHGGRIAASSPGRGQGAAFTIRLPLASRDEKDVAPPTLGPATHEDNCLAGLHILLVEDEPDARDLMQRVLNARGAQVTPASNAEQALAAFAAGRPDVIVSDIGMPGQDGFALLREVRSRENGAVPAVALTALARPEDRSTALAAGYQAHVVKPVDLQALVHAICEVSGRK